MFRLFDVGILRFFLGFFLSEKPEESAFFLYLDINIPGFFSFLFVNGSFFYVAVYYIVKSLSCVFVYQNINIIRDFGRVNILFRLFFNVLLFL